MPARRAGTASPNASRREPAPRRVELGADLRIARAGEVFAALQPARRGASFVLAASEVARVDAAGLQALAVAAARWREQGIAWKWDEPSQALLGAARLAGLDAHLGLT
jgi:anti-anti-sigma regulatory factor